VKVLYHSAVLNYVEEEARQAFVAEMKAITSEREDVVWLSNEAPGIVPGLSDSLGALASSRAYFELGRNGSDLLATTHPHGESLHWLQQA